MATFKSMLAAKENNSDTTHFQLHKIHEPLFLAGFHREFERILKRIIPSTIQELIKQFTLPPYMIYAIGQSYYGQFGLGDRKTLTNYRLLSHASYLMTHIDSLYCNNTSFFIKSLYMNGLTELHGCGNNYFGNAKKQLLYVCGRQRYGEDGNRYQWNSIDNFTALFNALKR